MRTTIWFLFTRCGGALVSAMFSLHVVRAAEITESPQRAFIIPHIHWEGAVFKTREEYLDMGLPYIEKALYLLKKYPDYRFVLDQMCYVRPFLERYPAEVAVFRRFLNEGRLEIVGGTDTMNDNNVPSGESLVRQYLLSKSYFREKLGYDVTAGWALDTYGHNAQMPQILKLAGMKSYWFWRGVPTLTTPSEFSWQGLDGTQIPALWLPTGYGPLDSVPATVEQFGNLLRNRYDSLAPASSGADRVLLAGSDVSGPDEALPSVVAGFNQAGGPLIAQLATPAEFEVAVAKRSPRPVLRGELNPIFQGTFSTLIELTQERRRMESLLTDTEKMSVAASLMRLEPHPEIIDEAWEPVLFNERHDIADMVDKEYEEELRDYEHVRRLAEGEFHRASDALIEHINTAGDGLPLIVFNSLSWPRTDVAEVNIGFSDPGVQSFAVRDSKGKSVPIQFLNVTRNGDGVIREARIAFIVHDIPAVGYAVYHAVPNVPGSSVAPPISDDWYNMTPESWAEGRGTMENEFYRATVDLRTGAMISLIQKDNHWEVLAHPGNVVAREYDGGDFWELRGPLGIGAQAVKRPVLAPGGNDIQWSSNFGGFGKVSVGPVFSEFKITHPLGKNAFGTRVRMYRDLRRIDIATDLTNQEEFVRYRAVFPTTLHKATVTGEIPFGAIERPQNAEYPVQNWMDYGDGNKGVALLNRGLPGNNVADGQLIVSLLRSARFGDYPELGLRSSDVGLEIGRRHTLEYAIVPHTGDWRSAQLWRAGLEFNNPLVVQTAATHSGDLPSQWGLLDISSDHVVVSALKPGKDGVVVLRVYEAAGKPAQGVHARFHGKISDVHEANLLEDAGAPVASGAEGFTFDLKPFEIKTFRLRLEM
jgi:alpha-mannosidase